MAAHRVVNTLVSQGILEETDRLIFVTDDWSGVGFTREQIVEETSSAVRAYIASRSTS